MNLAFAAVVGGGIFFLAKKAGGPSAASDPLAEGDPKAVLTGPDGAKPDQGGKPTIAFPTLGGGGASTAGGVKTLTATKPTLGILPSPGVAAKVQAITKAQVPSTASKKSGLVAGKKPLTETFQPKKATAKKTQPSEAQRDIQAAKGLNPGLRF